MPVLTQWGCLGLLASLSAALRSVGCIAGRGAGEHADCKQAHQALPGEAQLWKEGVDDPAHDQLEANGVEENHRCKALEVHGRSPFPGVVEGEEWACADGVSVERRGVSVIKLRRPLLS